MTRLKEFELILSSFDCDKHCPYCTAKVTKWKQVPDKLETIKPTLDQLYSNGYSFCDGTIGGNGEPSLYSISELSTIADAFTHPAIECPKILTSGNIFFDDAKFNLLHDAGFMFEVTCVNTDLDKDRAILGYERNYFDTDNFRKARVKLNHVVLIDSMDTLVDELKHWLDTYPSIETVSVKTLNANTRSEDLSCSISQWILKYAFPKSENEKIREILGANFEEKTQYNADFDVVCYKYKDKTVYMSCKFKTYGFSDVVMYGGELVDYSLKKNDILNQKACVKKVYFAGKFAKTYDADGKLRLDTDFRVPLLGFADRLMNWNDNSFVTENILYIGPFYNEKASCGKFTSTDCDMVVETELDLINKADIFAAYLTDELSPGSITEMIHAAYGGKDIILFYTEQDTGYHIKSDYWFPMTATKQILQGRGNITFVKIDRVEEIYDYFKKIRD